MVTKVLNKTIAYAAFCVLLTNISATRSIAREDYSTGRTRIGSVEKVLLRELGLAEDINDAEVVDLLDDPGKRTSAVILLIRYKRISSATPKLLQIFNDSKTSIFEKIATAKALCDFGNKEWMPTIKALSTDPNGMISYTPLKIDVAGLLARAGDYSQFEVVAKGISDSRDYIRSTAVHELGNFGHKTDPVTNSAVELLTSVAISDPVPWLRERAVYSLEKIAKIKPEVTSKVIDALKANIDSPDKNLRIICNAKLKSYAKKLKKEEGQ